MSETVEDPAPTLEVGQTVERVRVVTDADIRAFAELSGDRNPVHLDDAFAARSIFKGRVAHGMLAGALISAVLATDLPGPGAVYLSQKLDFKRPIRPGDEATIKITLISLEPPRAVLSTQIRVNGKLAVDGEAVAALPMTRG